MSAKRYNLLPPIVLALMVDHSAWLVGSGAPYYLGEREDEPRDWDLIVSPANWNAACRAIRLAGGLIQFNTFGGLKVNGSMDVWCSTLDEFATNLPKASAIAVRMRPEQVVRIG